MSKKSLTAHIIIDIVIHVLHKWSASDVDRCHIQCYMGFLLGTCSDLFQIVPIFEVIKQ